MICVASVQEKQVSCAELQHNSEGSEKRNVKLVSQLQDAEAAADQYQVRLVLCGHWLA